MRKIGASFQEIPQTTRRKTSSYTQAAAHLPKRLELHELLIVSASTSLLLSRPILKGMTLLLRTSTLLSQGVEIPARRASLPLLTDIEAPSITLAASPWGDDDVHEWAERERLRPKSGLRSAFMNMANSIIGAGIIGQPYAFRQAGLLTGIILLILLTITVDWTIRLIVINSKLSGSNSFQGTVEHCFGKPGLIAISIAQWAFAFGGMVAFGIIVGDSIPHVLAAVFPGLGDIPVLSLLTNRRAVIVIFILGISYPLSLYRDIAKVRRASKLLKSELTKIAGKSKHSCIDQHGGYFIHSCHPGVFCAQRIKRYL